MNWPWTKWFWRDWQADANLGHVNAEARGVWLEMLSMMAQGGRYGYLETAGGKSLTDGAICRLGRIAQDELDRARVALLDAGIPGVEDGTGIWFSRRMVREDSARTLGQRYGKAGGGNPSLKEDKNQDTRTQIPESIGSKGCPKAPLYTPPIKGDDGKAMEWTLEDFKKAAQTLAMRPEDVEACYHNYAAVDFIDAANRKITSIHSLLAKWKSNQHSRGQLGFQDRTKKSKRFDADRERRALS